ncbi:hypothetical protein HSB1_46190 [Halogranum salarium B-1]|uniref:Uncharacterized protein n=1 Tax=Halogranum salarium B-1 TaxID=1210908 RepID=J2ZW45_9EURY|nr:hypothetical protein HSB1_46190 [Halogranum salarium B-1]
MKPVSSYALRPNARYRTGYLSGRSPTPEESDDARTPMVMATMTATRDLDKMTDVPQRPTSTFRARERSIQSR